MKTSRTAISWAVGWILCSLWAALILGACSSGGVEEVGSVGQSLTKGTPGAVNGDSDYCDNPSFKCVSGEGDCESNAQCVTGLSCKSSFGPRWGFSDAVSTCMLKTCSDGVKNGTETGVDCGGSCGPCYPNCSVGTNGSATFCSQWGTCLCGQGQGSCTANAACQPGLLCQRLGAQFGFSASTRVCSPAHCTDGVQNAGETGVDCGVASGCGNCLTACVPPAGSATFCDTCICSGGQGDCDSDLQCATGLVCLRLGGQFNQDTKSDVCVPPHCGNGVQDAGETGVDCGTASGCGNCLTACVGGTPGSASIAIARRGSACRHRW